MYRSEEGREYLRQEYREQLRRRADQVETGLPRYECIEKMRHIGVPRETCDELSRFAEPLQTIATGAVARFFRGKEFPTLILFGPTGVGKTFAAGLAMLYFAKTFPWNSQATGDAREPLAFESTGELARANRFDDAYRDRMRTLEKARFLVLDEMGLEGGEDGRSRVAALVMTRHNALRATVITGNLTPDLIRTNYSPALADRLRTGALAPNLSGEKSLRKRKDAA